MSEKETPGTSKKQGEDGPRNQSKHSESLVDAQATSERLESIRTNLNSLFSRLTLHAASDNLLAQQSGQVLEDLTFESFLKHWKDNGFKRIITMVGAGISTSSGIPDFRSPGSGLYDNLQKYNLPHPTDIFELDYFMGNPKPFFTLAKELYPGHYIPSPAHYFIRLLNDKNLLTRHYTQNIDCLERLAGIPEEKLVEAHGTFHTNHCVDCNKFYTKEWLKEKIFGDILPVCEECNGIVKPDIVFFGENMPDHFYTKPLEDFADCDLLIIMGTSLEVYPFASLVANVKPNCIRVLINRVAIDKFSGPDKKRDITFLGDCDDAVWQMADVLGWTNELKDLWKRESSLFEQARKKSDTNADQEAKSPRISKKNSR
ncbi:PREDICTED: NAD-dependent protein deacetylase Sirt2-like isoform X1 [Rhagoletis zephyria]|uniref:NAD-dependent protein deacetylase Sirt2-like isoform X1 n=1 Tax=Rhagoletis zephyria TaxID=28612 RepID=UPI0008113511|nr:PREDICTED: NAD-dependent protein deacetylase Sirt2-like isoform X1 [Rhagoletis zephyria]